MLEIRRFKRPLAYVSVEGKRAASVPGLFGRVSTAVARDNIRIYAVSSGDDDFGMFVLDEDARNAKKAVEKELEKVRKYFEVSIVHGIGMITVKGERVLSEKKLHETVDQLLRERGTPPFTMVETMDNSLKLFFTKENAPAAYMALTERLKYLVDYA